MLVIRRWGDSCILCDGTNDEGIYNPDEYCLGNIVAHFHTWEDADRARKAIYKILNIPEPSMISGVGNTVSEYHCSVYN